MQFELYTKVFFFLLERYWLTLLSLQRWSNPKCAIHLIGLFHKIHWNVLIWNINYCKPNYPTSFNLLFISDTYRSKFDSFRAAHYIAVGLDKALPSTKNGRLHLHYVNALSQCANSCLADELCVSFNYDDADGLTERRCELFARSYERWHLVSQMGTSYFIVKPDIETV